MAEFDDPSLADLVDLLTSNLQNNLNFARPGKVLSFDWQPRPRARIQLGHDLVTRTGERIPVPPIANVPVLYYSAGSLTIRSELKRGDGVLCIVMDRAFRQWLTQGGRTQGSESGRRHNLNDIIALPILRPTATEPKIQPGADELYIGDDKGIVNIRVNAKTGEIQVNGANVSVNATGTATVKATGVATVEAARIELKAFAGLPGGPFNVVGVNAGGLCTHVTACAAPGSPVVWTPNPAGQVVIP